MVFWIPLSCLGCLHVYSLCICQYLVFSRWFSEFRCPGLVVLVVYVNEAVRRKRGSLLRERDNTLFLYLYPGSQCILSHPTNDPKKHLQRMWTAWRKIEANQYNFLGTDSSCCIHPWYLCNLKLVMSYEVFKILRCHDIMSVARKEKREKKFCVHHRCHQTKTETKNGNMDFCSNFMRTSVEKDFRALPKLSLPKFWWWWWNDMANILGNTF